jgi:hypothetical protein
MAIATAQEANVSELQAAGPRHMCTPTAPFPVPTMGAFGQPAGDHCLGWHAQEIEPVQLERSASSAVVGKSLSALSCGETRATVGRGVCAAAAGAVLLLFSLRLSALPEAEC